MNIIIMCHYSTDINTSIAKCKIQEDHGPSHSPDDNINQKITESNNY